MLITDEERKILEVVYVLRSPRVKDMHRLALPNMHLRTFQRRVQELVKKNLLIPKGSKKERTYWLRKEGATHIGKVINAKHQRNRSGHYLDVLRVKLELEHLVIRRGWRLHEGIEAFNVLRAYLFFITQQHYQNQRIEPHQVLPSDFIVAPDLLLQTRQAAYPVIIASPNAREAYWEKRLTKYRKVLANVTIIVLVSEYQYAYADEVLNSSPYKQRFVLLRFDELDQIERQILQKAL